MRRVDGTRGLSIGAHALVLIALLTGCKTTPEKALEKEREVRREQVERIVDRTITVPGETVREVVNQYIDLPADLTKPCPITHNKDRTVGEYVRVANQNTLSLEECARRMNEIRALQPSNKERPSQ